MPRSGPKNMPCDDDDDEDDDVVEYGMWMLKEKMKKNDHKGAPAWPFGAARQRYNGVVLLLLSKKKAKVLSLRSIP